MNVDNLNWSIEFYESNIVECNQTIKELEDFDGVPVVTAENLHYFKDGDLVRYQGMVQDMLNQEYYYPTYSIHDSSKGTSVVKSGKFRDLTCCQENEELKLDGNVPAERLVFFCIPIPAQSRWVQNYVKKSELPVSPPGGCKKRPMEDDESDKKMTESCSKEVHKNIRISSETTATSSSNEIHSSDKYFPLQEKNGLPCIVKIYENEEHCNVILNDRIEVIGFISLNPALESTWEDSDAEDRALHPPPSLVPRIHAIFTRKLNHCNPLLKQNAISDEIIDMAEKVRSDLHLVLTQILYGDHLAADYVLCYLLSRVYARSDGQAVGKFSLNLCNVKNETYAQRLFEILETLVPNCQYLPLTIESLNEKSFVPRKDYETNRLWSGRLQLSDDTYILLDETKMSEGKLENTGCLNVAALQNLIRDQEINYDFSYYSLKYNTNIPVLILSEGKSMFEADIRVKLNPEPSTMDTIGETFDAAAFFLNGEISDGIRKYLTLMRLGDFEMTEEVNRKIVDDYVKMRQEKTGVSPNDLYNLVVLSRLLAISHGRTTLSVEDWTKALNMESDRKSRF